ncbi:hypothetical protein OF83DRAFT_764176 [Amylostereum chailletii]|nr:hypothetical protein OF83DRAFT_764176 [Amylostereum chailletii]
MCDSPWTISMVPSPARYAETFLQEAIVDQFGAGPLMRRVCRDLQDKNGAFAIDLAALIRFFRMLCAHPDLHRLLFSMNAYQCVLSAMKRQIYGTNEDRRMCMENWAEGCVEMLICHGIVGVLAHGIELCATRSWAETEVYVRIIVKLTASAIVSAGMFSTEQHSSFKILCDDVRAVWWPALRALREMRRTAPRKEHTRLVDVWTGLGDKTGLNEEEERRRHEQGAAETMKEKLAFCAWMECEFHSTKPSHALRTCAGCNTVRYCDKVCQIRRAGTRERASD